MHPILFKIPLPNYPLQLAWVLWAAAGLTAAYAAWQLIRKARGGALVAGLLAAGAAGAGLYLRGQTWDMGAVPIYSYGVMLGLSLVVGWYLTLGLAERDGLPKETMANNYVVTAIAAVAGSRVLYILTNLGEFDSVASMFAMRRGGLVAYGGFLGGFLGSYFFLRRHKIKLLPWADVAVPSLASGLMITRIGCYLFGCDFGHPLPAGAPGFLKTLGSFPHWAEGTLDHGSGSPAWVQHVKKLGLSQTADFSFPVHPTQLYESLVGAGLLVLLLVARRNQKFRGQIFLLFTFAYGVCRYLLEILRDDDERGSIGLGLPEHVLIPLGLAIFAVGYVIGFSKVIKSPVIQRVTQVLSFVPAVALYVVMKPETFAGSSSGELSTSQAVALTTGFAAAAAFSVFYKAALAHPEAAMALNLPAPAVEGAARPGETDLDDEDDEDDDEEEDADEAAARPRKRGSAAARGAEAERVAGGSLKSTPTKRKKKAAAAKPADAGEPPVAEGDGEAAEET